MELAQLPGFSDAVRKVEKTYEADVYLYSGAIDSKGFGSLAAAVAGTKGQQTNPNGLLILTTHGGLANSAYQMARLMQQTYDRFILFTPSFCKSAGTVVALGAHEIVMDVFSELGPLDVQLMDKDEIGARKSGLLTRSAFEALSTEAFDMFSKQMLGIKAASSNLVSFKLAAEIASRLTVELMSPVFAQLNPEVIGSDYRDLSVATEYGTRLAKVSRNPKADTVRRLVADYPAHDFIIDREEAETLFKNVQLPSDELYDLVRIVKHVAYQQSRPSVVEALRAVEEKQNDDGAQSPPDEAGSEQRPAGEAADAGSPADKPVDEGRTGDRPSDKRSRGAGKRTGGEGTLPDSGSGGD